jgi:acid phosphatase (class A)
MKRKPFFLSLLSLLFVFCSKAQNAQYNHRQASLPVGHYKDLGLLDGRPDPIFSWMDTIKFPAKDVTTGILAATKMRTVYLIEDIPSLLDLPAPPANSSAQTRAELAYMLELQAKRTPGEVARYKKLAGIFHSPNNFNPYDPDYDRNFSSLFHIGGPLGSWFTYKNLPLTAQFLSDVYRDATYYFFKQKLSINRPRPYMLEPKLNALEKPPHPSYPSGHSAASYINAYIVMEIVPDLAEEFLKMAAEMAFSREVIGVHYPGDSEVSRVWARRFVNELFSREKFRLDFEKAKKEILDRKKTAAASLIGKGDKKHDHSSCDAACSSSCNESCSSDSSCCADQ